MARAIDQLSKTVEEKDIQIASLMNKLEAQKIGESSQGLSHPPGFTPPVAPTNKVQHESLSKQVVDETFHNTSIGSLSMK